MKRNALLTFKTGQIDQKNTEGHRMWKKPLFMSWQRSILFEMEEIKKAVGEDFIVNNLVIF